MVPAGLAGATGVLSPELGPSDALLGGAPEAARDGWAGWAPVEGSALDGGAAPDAGGGDLPRESASGAAKATATAGERASAAAPIADTGAELEAPRPAHLPSGESAAQASKPGAELALFDALGEARAERAERWLGAEQGAEVLKQVRMHLAPGLREATLHLEPAWLGRVTIKIAVRAGRARAELRAERVEALEALERHLPELRAALAERGFGDAEVDLDLGLEHTSGAPGPQAPAAPSVGLALAASLAGAAGTEPGGPLILHTARAVDTYA